MSELSPSEQQPGFVEAAKVFISHLQRAWLEGDGMRVVYVTDRSNRDALFAAAKYLLQNDDAFRYVLGDFYELGAGPETNTVAVHLHRSVLSLPDE